MTKEKASRARVIFVKEPPILGTNDRCEIVPTPEGLAFVIMSPRTGNTARVTMSPDEARALGIQAISCAAVAEVAAAQESASVVSQLRDLRGGPLG